MMYAMHYSNYHQKVRQERERECFFRGHLCKDMAQVDLTIKIKINRNACSRLNNSLHKLYTHTHTHTQKPTPFSLTLLCTFAWHSCRTCKKSDGVRSVTRSLTMPCFRHIRSANRSRLCSSFCRV